MREKLHPPHRSVGAGVGLPGRGRTFAAYLQHTTPAPELPEPCSLVFPHRVAVEAAVGRGLELRALLDPAGCAERGVEGYVVGSTACFAVTDPPVALAVRLARQVLANRR